MGLAREKEFSLSEREFKFICDLVYTNTGIVLDERKREMLYRRLMKRTRELRLPDFHAYCEMLKDESCGELSNFLNAITTNLTSFFRENHHFDYLRDHFIPAHLKQNSANKRLRIWSSACSTGEEPYSLAITLMQAMQPVLHQWDAKILATDIDTEVLQHAKNGIYTEDRIKSLPKKITSEWFKLSPHPSKKMVKVSPKLNNLITFNQLNLLRDWPMRGPFDVILCRNVLIYFDRPTQEKLIHRFHQMLRPGGLLMLGHSESGSKDESLFEHKGKTIFEKRA